MRVQLFATEEACVPVEESSLSLREYERMLAGLHATVKHELTRRRSVREFPFSVRALNMMRRYRMEAVGDLLDVTWQQLLKMDGFGVVCVNEVARELSWLGLEGTAFHQVAQAGSKQAAERKLVA